jgi:hypothetical protein
MYVFFFLGPSANHARPGTVAFNLALAEAPCPSQSRGWAAGTGHPHVHSGLRHPSLDLTLWTVDDLYPGFHHMQTQCLQSFQ